MARRTVVVLVDSRRRDLMGAALIAHHLDALGIDVHLEPLGAYRAVLGAYRPDLILFNHLTASHLVAYSQRLAQLGVLTAVLPNEGLVYHPDILKFIAGRHHRGAHIDLFFCWNEAHRAALVENGFDARTRIEVVGVPRFDFYFEPWSGLFTEGRREREPGARPRVLVCTDFVLAKFHELPPDRADRFFATWKDRIPLYADYRTAIAVAHRARARFMDFADAIVAADRFDVTLRPHPHEDARPYAQWLERVPAAARPWVRIDADSNITPLILDTDVEVSCETCTTALESWIARKPTVELVFSRHPMFFHDDVAALTALCESPDTVAATIDAQLRAPDQREFAEGRRAYLARQCSSPDGRSSLRIATAIAEAVDGKRPGAWTDLQWPDRRRALRLHGLHRMGLPYTYDPFLPVKRWIGGKHYATRVFRHGKTITPRDVAHARSLLRLAAQG